MATPVNRITRGCVQYKIYFSFFADFQDRIFCCLILNLVISGGITATAVVVDGVDASAVDDTAVNIDIVIREELVVHFRPPTFLTDGAP